MIYYSLNLTEIYLSRVGLVQCTRPSDNASLTLTVLLKYIFVYSSKPSTKDEPWAWEAREFLRKKLIGKEVLFTADKAPNATRESGFIFLGPTLAQSENIVESLVSEGLVSLRGDTKSPDFANLQKFEEIAKAQGRGIHSHDSPQVINMHLPYRRDHTMPTRSIVLSTKPNIFISGPCAQN